MSEKNNTSAVEWGGVIITIIAISVIIYIIFYLLRPRLFSGSGVVSDGRPSNAVVCPTSPAPINLQAVVNDVSKASFDASWDSVLTTTSPNQIILGYNVYISKISGITKQNTTMAGFTPVSRVRATVSSAGALEFDTIYYFRVATVDSCGEGELSTEEIAIST